MSLYTNYFFIGFTFNLFKNPLPCYILLTYKSHAVLEKADLFPTL